MLKKLSFKIFGRNTSEIKQLGNKSLIRHFGM